VTPFGFGFNSLPYCAAFHAWHVSIAKNREHQEYTKNIENAAALELSAMRTPVPSKETNRYRNCAVQKSGRYFIISLLALFITEGQKRDGSSRRRRGQNRI